MKHIALFISICLFVLSCTSSTSTSKKEVKKTIIDLSHEYSAETVYWVTEEGFKLDTAFKGITDNGYYYTANSFKSAEHGGTHLDAPIHFAEGRQSVDEIPLEKLVGSAIKIDVSSKADNSPDYLISIEDLMAWENEHGQIPDNSIVLLYTGHSKYYPNLIEYLGTDHKGFDAIKELHFPGLSPEAAQWLVENRSINAIGIDTPSIDYGQSTLFESHVTLLSENIPVFENLASLEELPSSGFEVFALPMKIKKGSGGPLRIIAIIEE